MAFLFGVYPGLKLYLYEYYISKNLGVIFVSQFSYLTLVLGPLSVGVARLRTCPERFSGRMHVAATFGFLIFNAIFNVLLVLRGPQ